MPDLDFDEREKEKIRENKTYDKFDLHEPRDKVLGKEIIKEKRLEIEIPIEKEKSALKNIYDESRREKFNHGECAVLTDEKRLRKDTKPWIKSLDDSGVSLRGTARTKNIDDSFIACSQIRETLLKEFPKSGVEFAYPHIEIVRQKK